MATSKEFISYLEIRCDLLTYLYPKTHHHNKSLSHNTYNIKRRHSYMFINTVTIFLIKVGLRHSALIQTCAINSAVQICVSLPELICFCFIVLQKLCSHSISFYRVVGAAPMFANAAAACAMQVINKKCSQTVTLS